MEPSYDSDTALTDRRGLEHAETLGLQLFVAESSNGRPRLQVALRRGAFARALSVGADTVGAPLRAEEPSAAALHSYDTFAGATAATFDGLVADLAARFTAEPRPRLRAFYAARLASALAEAQRDLAQAEARLLQAARGPRGRPAPGAEAVEPEAPAAS